MISINDLKKNGGLEEIIKILHKIFWSHETKQAYHGFKDYVGCRPSSGQSVFLFLVEYQKWYREIDHYKLYLPTEVQVFFLIKAPNLTHDLEKLVRTTGTLVYGDMKASN